MRRIALILPLLMLVIFLSACGSISSSKDLILSRDKVDQITLGIVAGEGVLEARDLNDLDKIKIVLNLLKDIKVEELPVEQEQEIFQNAKLWSEKVSHNLSFISTTEINDTDPRSGANGHITILRDGSLIFDDPNTFGPFKEGKMKRTISYISLEKHPNIIEQILRIME